MALHSELTAREFELSILEELASVVVSDLGLVRATAQICSMAMRLVNARSVVLPFLSPDRLSYSYISAHGEDAEGILGASASVEVGMCGWVLRNEKPLIFGEHHPENILDGSRWEPGKSVSLLVPLFGKRQIIGGLAAIGRPDDTSFRDRDLEILSLFASQASVAIENAALVEELRQHNHNLEIAVADRTCELQRANVRLETNIKLLAHAHEGLKASEAEKGKSLQMAERARASASESYKRARVVLDAISDVLVIFNIDGNVEDERSRSANELFGLAAGPSEIPVWDLLDRLQEGSGEYLQLGWEALLGGALPVEVSLHQLPKRLCSGPRIYQLSYQLLPGTESRVERLRCLLVISDVTSRVQASAAEAETRELASLFEQLAEDCEGIVDLMQEVDDLLARVTSDASTGPERLRALHTLKGTFGLFDMQSFALICHKIESSYASSTPELSRTSTADLLTMWDRLRTRVRPVAECFQTNEIEVSKLECDAVVDTLRKDALDSHHRIALAQRIETWRHEPVRKRLLRVRRKIEATARRQGKGPVKVTIEDNGVRLPKERWERFWSGFVHLVNNAVDHGLEERATRLELHKPPTGRIDIAVHATESGVTIEISDDGRGINWEDVGGKASEMGLRFETYEDKLEALCHDGLTTKQSVSLLSGRGMGLSALRATTIEMNGSMDVSSETDRGTTFRFTFPTNKAVPSC